MSYLLYHPASPSHATAQSLLAQSAQNLHRLIYTVANVDEAYDALMQKGIESAWPPKGEQSIRNCGILDDNGITVTICADQQTHQQTNDPTHLYAFHHINILTDDWRRTRDFYTQTFGLRVIMEFVDENDGAFLFLADPDFNFSDHNMLLEITGPPFGEQRESDYFAQHGAGIDHICYTSADVDAAYEALISAGAMATHPPYDAWGTRLAWVKDSNGRDIELMLPPSEEDFA